MDNVLFNSAIDPHKTSVYPTRAKVGNFERRGDFTVWYDGKRSRVAFFLKDAVGDETYRLCLHLEPVGAPPQEVLSSMRPTISFSSVHDGRFVVYCKVSFRPQKNASLWAPTESVLGTFLEYSKKDPKLMMTFECADGTVEAVTSIMCSRSPVIDAMMKMDCIEARTRRVKIVDFSAEVIEKMVEFCQSNYVKFTEGFATDLYRVSDKYDIQGLKKAAKKLILRNINAENVIQLFQFSRRFTFEELEEECLGYAVYNLKLINKSSKFVEVEADVLKEFWLAMHDFQEICDKGEPASKKAKVGPVCLRDKSSRFQRDRCKKNVDRILPRLMIYNVVFYFYGKSWTEPVCPAFADDSDYDDEGEFVILVDGLKTKVAFVLKSPNGNETYVSTVYVGNHSDDDNRLCTTNQGVIEFEREENKSYFIACLVRFVPTNGLLFVTAEVMLTLLDYCRRNPELLMTFQCTNGAAKIVTAIMCSRSSVIDKMMKKDSVVKETRTVKVKFSVEVIRKMIHFCECNELVKPAGFEMDLFRIANQYEMERMIECTGVLLKDAIRANNAIEMYLLAVTYELRPLQRRCLNFCLMNWYEIARCTNLDSYDGEVLKNFWMTLKNYRDRRREKKFKQAELCAF